jgi:ATP-dependent DNA helicase RecQ
VWLPGKAVRSARGTSAGESTSGSGQRRRRSTAKTSNLRRALELYRNRTAKKLSWKPYMVLHKKVILQLEETRPKTLEQLYEIDGLGPAKVDRFGWELLDIVRRYDL